MPDETDPAPMRRAQREVARNLPEGMIGEDTEDVRDVRQKRREREG
jgi:hypothetical protein